MRWPSGPLEIVRRAKGLTAQARQTLEWRHEPAGLDMLDGAPVDCIVLSWAPDRLKIPHSSGRRLRSSKVRGGAAFRLPGGWTAAQIRTPRLPKRSRPASQTLPWRASRMMPISQ
jgi:hypothetical protein